MSSKILILGLVFLLRNQFSSEIISISPELFPDPIERVYIIMKDDMAFKHTSHEERFLCLSAGILEETLKKTPYKIKDIAIIIHNHRIKREFSESDCRFYRDLNKRGFKGLFLLYCHWTNNVYCMEKKDKKANVLALKEEKETF